MLFHCITHLSWWWLTRCATILNVAGSIHEGVIDVFHLLNSSGRSTALGSTHPLAEISNSVSGGG